MLFRSWFDLSPKGAQPLGYIAVFCVIALLLTLTGRLLQGFIQLLSLGFLNSIVGGIFGGLKIALIISILLNVLQGIDHRIKVVDPELKEESILYRPIKELAPELWEDLTYTKPENA